tara:strand:+ start:930 stop:1628 length:699 start_codon:yes stop_codon:yes gene_type:complete
MAFKMKGSSYKMGGVKTKNTMAYMKSTAMKHNVDDNKEHQDEFGENHSEDLQTEAEHRRSFETSNKSDNQKMSKKIVRTDLDKPMGEGKAPTKQLAGSDGKGINVDNVKKKADREDDNKRIAKLRNSFTDPRVAAQIYDSKSASGTSEDIDKMAPIKHSGIHGTKSHKHPHGNPRTKVPMKQTDFFDKVKSAGKAIYNNVGKVNSVGNSLSDKISSDYNKNKKVYRDNAKKN